MRYINGTNQPVSIAIPDFRQALVSFVSTVENRLHAFGLKETDLSALFSFIKEEEQSEDSKIYRKLEALMGFDPDECASDTMDYAVGLYRKYGESTLLELAPLYGKMGTTEPLKPIEQFIDAPGVYGKPAFSTKTKANNPQLNSAPWMSAVESARELRSEMGNIKKPISTHSLFELLGISSSHIDKWEPVGRSSVSVGIPAGEQNFKFIPRKKHPISKRFELSRYIADCMQTTHDQWLTNTDLGTARQKYQRAFAAEFLCPIHGLVEFLAGDYSTEAIEDAAYHFDVSEQTVVSLLANNHCIEHPSSNESPYHMGYS